MFFFDSPVANIYFETASTAGKTNQNGEFNYQQGEQITFSIGDVRLPSITAKDIITPLDIFRNTVVKNTEVINLARLLQTLDTDNNPENGIELPDEIDLTGADQSIAFYNSETFENSVADAFQKAGIDATLVDSGTAATHLSNSLLTRGFIDIIQIDPSILSAEITQNRRLPDLDIDGIADTFDLDDDGDNVPDLEDEFPQDNSEQIDSDRDGVGDNSDRDDDNDGITDVDDQFPFDSTESTDSDGDDLGNYADEDDDNDGTPDYLDRYPTDPAEQIDTDLDGTGDNLDQYPTDPTEQFDTDNDGIGNNADTDDDNDGTLDTNDQFPFDPTEQIDSDNDGLGNNTDQDDDNDGTEDHLDKYPTDSNEQIDSDNDGIGNNADDDDDNDGTLDTDDALPLNPNEISDKDNDGIGDNTDDDNDNDGTVDLLDIFPLDPTESSDNHEDGIGDNADQDDDNDQVPDDEDAFPFDANESSDSDNDGIGDNVDFDRDNDGVDDVDDTYPDDPNEQYDTDGDTYGDNEDPDDDNDGVLDLLDVLPLDSTETKDTDKDGIGNNADQDDDNDGVLDVNDIAPLKRSCGTEEHNLSELCADNIVDKYNFIENMGDSMFLFDRNATTALQIQLSTGDALATVDFSAHTTAGDFVTAVEYHENHQRLYVAFSNGNIVYFMQNSTEATLFYIASERVSGFTEVGNLLYASEYVDVELRNTNVLKASGFLLKSFDSYFPDLNTSAWNSNDQHIYMLAKYYDGITRRSIDLETGAVRRDTYTNPDRSVWTPRTFIQHPFTFSPDGRTTVSVDGKAYSSDGTQMFEEETFSSVELTDLRWTIEGLVTTRPSGYQTMLEHRTSDLAINDAQTLTGEPLELLYNDGIFYIITGSEEAGMLINAYTPSETGAATLTTAAPEPGASTGNGVLREEDIPLVDTDGDGIDDTIDQEYVDFVNSVQGHWETECNPIEGSNSVYSIHSQIISGSEIRSALVFYTDSNCKSYLGTHLNRSNALHRSVISYGEIVDSTSGLPSLKYTIETTDAVNSPPFPIHFSRENIMTVQDSKLYFGTVGLTNRESLKLDENTPYTKVDTSQLANLLESIDNSVATGDFFSLEFDHDRDGVISRDDKFPNDPTEYQDSDNDGIGDNADPDDDNDGLIDLEDPDPFN